MAPMKPVQSQVKALFAHALQRAFPSIQQEVLVVKGQPKYGDYQCNNAMGIFKDHGRSLGYTSAPAVAEAIRANLPENDLISDISIGGPGFVTVKLRQAWIDQRVVDILGGDIECSDVPRKRVVVDFSSPNIAKEMHVGHLRSTIIGESTCRILEFCGHEVHRLNHVGDWGTQFGMLIEYMKEAYPDFQEQLPEIGDLQEFYKASKKRFDEDEEFKRKAQLSVVDLQKGGEFARSAWQKICDVSRVAFNKIYDRLGITVEERGESFYNSLIPPIVEELKARGLCVESDGATCLFTPSVSEIPLMAVKSDGGFGYDSTDLAAIYHRLFMMRADWIVYITDLGQELHFHMIFENITSFMRDFGFVPQRATTDQALDAFDLLTRKLVLGHLDASFGAVGLPYSHVVAMVLPMTGMSLDVLSANVPERLGLRFYLAAGMYGLGYSLVYTPLWLWLCMRITSCCPQLTRAWEAAFVAFVIAFLACMAVGLNLAFAMLFLSSVASWSGAAVYSLVLAALSSAALYVYFGCRQTTALSPAVLDAGTAELFDPGKTAFDAGAGELLDAGAGDTDKPCSRWRQECHSSKVQLPELIVHTEL